MKKIILISVMLCIVLAGVTQQKISQYTRTDSLKGTTPPYVPDSALMDVSVYNFLNSYSTRAITFDNLKKLIFAGDTTHLKTTGDNGYGTYNFYGDFQTQSGVNLLINKPYLTYSNYCGAGHIYGTDYFFSGIIQSASDTTAEIGYENATLDRNIKVRRNYIETYFDRNATSSNKITVKSDSLNIMMNNIKSTFWDTLGNQHNYNNTYLGDGTDTLFFNSSDTITDIITSADMTGNIANSTVTMDTVFTDYVSEGNFVVRNVTVTLVDDGTWNFPDAKTIKYDIFVSGGDENAIGTVTTVGVVLIGLSYGTTLWDNADTDTKYCIYDGGTYAVLKNRSGASKTFFITLKYNK